MNHGAMVCLGQRNQHIELLIQVDWIKLAKQNLYLWLFLDSMDYSYQIY